MQVVALVHEENGRYGVSFPDFPGATTVGSSYEEAIAKGAEALAFHAEGLAEDGPLPEPRSLAALRNDPAFQEDANDAVVALVPYSPPGRAVRINMTVEESLLARADTAAAAEGETRSGIFAKAIREYLGAGRVLEIESMAGVDRAMLVARAKLRGASRMSVLLPAGTKYAVSGKTGAIKRSTKSGRFSTVKAKAARKERPKHA